MRVWALAVMALVLVAGCSDSGGGRPQTSAGSSAPPTRNTSPAPTSAKTPPQQPPPAAGAAIADVVSWVAAGEPADPTEFHSATRDGSVTELQNNDVAFTSPADKTSCMTDSMFSKGDLACLVLEPRNPPPVPAETYGQWAPGWIEFDGPTVTVGGVHGDPGRFIYGDGPELPYGKSLKFGDYQCRSDQTALYCVNNAHQSGAKISQAGVETFGCLRSVPPPADIGLKFSC